MTSNCAAVACYHPPVVEPATTLRMRTAGICSPFASGISKCSTAPKPPAAYSGTPASVATSSRVAEARRRRGSLAFAQDAHADAASRPLRMHEERTDARRLARRVEQRVLARLAPLVAAEQRLALAPAAATDDRAGVLDHEIRAIGDELPIDGEHGPQRAIDLRRGVVGCLQLPRRQRDQRLERGNVAPLRDAQRKTHPAVSARRAAWRFSPPPSASPRKSRRSDLCPP